MDKKKFFIWCAVKRNLEATSLRHTQIRYDYLFRWIRGRKLTAAKVEAFILYLREKNLRNASINSYIRIVNLIDIFERENGRDLNLLKKINYFPKQKRIPTILTKEEILAILSVNIQYARRNGCKGDSLQFSNYLNQNYKLALWMLACTGCRFDEMASLKKENLSLGIDKGYVEFIDTKNHDSRRVPLPPIYVQMLKDWVKDKKPNELVFTSSIGGKLLEQTFNPDLRKRQAKAGLSNKHIYAHCFRNSFIMEHIHRSTGHLTISKLVGHRDPKTTIEYTKYDYAELERGAENHFLFSDSLSPQALINRTVEEAEKWTIMQDPRFSKRIEKRENSLLIELYVK